MKRIISVLLLLCLLLSAVPGAQATLLELPFVLGQPYHAELAGLIKNEDSRAYVQMMLDYYIRTDYQIKAALRRGHSAVFLFEGCSDNMDHPDLQDLSYYRVSAVCIAVRLDDNGEPHIVYFNDDSSTLPDRPLEYGAWYFEEVGDVGPATICDGTYELYSVHHGGKYEALHIRTDYSDMKINAVYMTPEGYTKTRATEINIHTRTGNHILQYQMWSAGCVLVGDGDKAVFEELIESTYYAVYDEFVIDRPVGTLTIDRNCLKEAMYDLYENRDAVDMLLAASRRIQPDHYDKLCSREKAYEVPLKLCVRGTSPLMSLPCSNATDARSVTLGEVTRGQVVKATGMRKNPGGRLWYEIDLDGEVCYLYSGYAEEVSWRNWITRVFA